MISNEIIEKVKSAANVVDVIADYITLKKFGVNYKSCCPLHDEKTSSFVVSSAKGIFKCFGCGKGGDSIKFLMEYKKIEFIEAIKILADKYHIAIPEKEMTDKELDAYKKREYDLGLLAKEADEYAARIKNNNTALNYLYKRGFTSETITKWQIGWAESGYFFKRIIFPIQDFYGKIKGFTARVIEDREPKYLNSKESQYFKKGELLYGLFQAKQTIAKKEKVYLVEGQFDVIQLHQNGIENTIAASGTALTEVQIKLIKKYTRNLVLLLDSDNAGIKAALRDISLILKEGINLRIIVLPEGEDPDSFVLKNGKDSQKYFDHNEIDFIVFKCNIYQKEIESEPVKKAKYLTEITNDISLISDKNERRVFIQKAAEIFGIVENELNKDIRALREKIKEPVEEGKFFALEIATPKIKENKIAYMLHSFDEVIDKHLNNKENYIGLCNSQILKSEIESLKKITNSIIYDDYILDIFDKNEKEFKIITNLKSLLYNDFDIQMRVHDNKVLDEDSTEFIACEYINFTDFYINTAMKKVINSSDSLNQILIENIAEIISYLPETIRITKTTNVRQAFKKRGITFNAGDFKNILKVYVDKNKKIKHLNNINETSTIDIPLPETFDPNNLPPYVDKSIFLKTGFFAVRNKKNKEIYFLVKTRDENLMAASNFGFKIIGHVYHKESEMNKRLLHVTHEDGTDKYLELLSSELQKYERFSCRIYDLGPYFFYKKASFYYEKILAELSRNIPKMTELNQLGHNALGFYAFADGIFDYQTKKFKQYDTFGIVNFGTHVFYCKIFSVFNDKKNNSDEIAENVSKEDSREFFVYNRKNSPIPVLCKEKAEFNSWAKSMVDVYKSDNSGVFAILFSIITCFRDIFMEKLGHCPILLFTGETNAGKSQVAESILNLFAFKYPVFNLLSGSDAAFFNLLEFAANFPTVGDEYNDIQVTDTKFQGSKATYDGIGKQKISATNINERKVYQVLTSLLILGQEMPERDDQALLNRSLHCIIPKKSFTEEEDAIYKRLKNFENAGLSEVLCMILSKRNDFKTYFSKNEKEVKKDLKECLNNKNIITRVLNTGSEFLATAKTFIDASPELEFPIKYDDLKKIILKKIVDMSSMVTSTNRVSNFFDIILHLTNQKKLMYGRDYIVYNCDATLVTKNASGLVHNPIKETTQVLFLRMNMIFNYYKDAARTEALKQNNLRSYLKNHQTFLGDADDIWFIFNVEEIVSEDFADENGNKKQRVIKKAVEQRKRTSCMAFNYLELGIDLLPAETQTQNKTEMPF